VALGLLRTVLRRRQPLDQALEADPALARLEGRDRAFARLLVATTLRRLGQIDAVIAACLNQPEPLKAEVQDLLRLGVAQLGFLGTPAHAAVDTTVALTTTPGTRPFRGLINAVLRRAAREAPVLIAGQDAGRLNTPDWLWLAWRQAWGMPRTRALVEAHLEEAPLDLSLKSDPAHWAPLLGGTVLANGTVRRPAGGAVTELPGFAEGAWWVQDAAAALPVRLLGDVRGHKVADLCAAPGGKTAQLVAAGAEVVALDRSAARLTQLRATLARLGFSASVIEADAGQWRPEQPLDAVLLDAPCSATGTIRRHPDLPRLKGPGDVAKLAILQARLLAHALTLVRPGGLVVYCVCSLQPEEGEHQIAALLAQAGGAVVREPVNPAEVGGWASLINPEGDLRSLPGDLADQGGLDGFYAARLRQLS